MEVEEYIKELSDDERYLFLLIYAAGNSETQNEKVTGNTWLQKEMFLLKQIIPKIQFRFDEHYYGAYSPALDILAKQNVISGVIKQQNNGIGKMWLSEIGLKIAKTLWDGIPNDERLHITDVKKFMNDMELWELIAYSYSTFPETTKNSDVVSQFEETRINSACSLFQRKKVSIEKASKIAGLTLDKFTLELKKRGIPSFSPDYSKFKDSLEYIESIT